MCIIRIILQLLTNDAKLSIAEQNYSILIVTARKCVNEQEYMIGLRDNLLVKYNNTLRYVYV